MIYKEIIDIPPHKIYTFCKSLMDLSFPNIKKKELIFMFKLKSGLKTVPAFYVVFDASRPRCPVLCRQRYLTVLRGIFSSIIAV